MEHNVIFSDEMHQACVGLFPPFLPRIKALGVRLAQLNGVGKVADGGIKPHIKHFSFGAYNGNRNAPFLVTCQGSRL